MGSRTDEDAVGWMMEAAAAVGGRRLVDTLIVWISTPNRRPGSPRGSSDAPPVAAAPEPELSLDAALGGTAAVMTRAAISSS